MRLFRQLQKHRAPKDSERMNFLLEASDLNAQELRDLLWELETQLWDAQRRFHTLLDTSSDLAWCLGVHRFERSNKSKITE